MNNDVEYCPKCNGLVNDETRLPCRQFPDNRSFCPFVSVQNAEITPPLRGGKDVMQLGLRGDGKGGVEVRTDDVRRAMESVRDATANPEVRRIMARALEAYNKQSPQAQAMDPGLTQDVYLGTLSKEGSD